MTLSRLSLLLGLVGLGAVSIGGARATARWATETRVAEATTSADRTATRRIVEAVVRARVRILLEQA
ncbi:MAG: hypothetical protein FJ361_07630 [Gemmatimonadetes bacterium]|nr:hypothetical protein [Gemmatimonadota bacterium]